MMQAKLLKRILSVMIGNILEWYDFALYGCLTPILAENFFPTKNKELALLGTMLAFAIGFIARPIGGILLGHFGDRYGRSKTMLYSIILITLPTFILGCIPSYQSIGILATSLLLACRLIQGLIIGGEYPGSILAIAEHIEQSKLGMNIRWVVVSPYMGVLIGTSLCSFLISFLSVEQMMQWGWRLPFLFSLVIGLCGFYSRRHLSETAEFLNLKQQNKILIFPFKEAVKKYFKEIVLVFLLLSSCAVSQYILLIYIVSYLHQLNHLYFDTILYYHNLSIAFVIISMLFGGGVIAYLSWKRYYLFTNILLFILGIPMFYLFQMTGMKVLIAFAMLGIMIGVMVNYMPYLLMTFFPTKLRYTAAALSYNLAFSIFAGLTPFVAALLVAKTGNLMMPGLLIMAACVLSLIVFFVGKVNLVTVNQQGEKDEDSNY